MKYVRGIAILLVFTGGISLLKTLSLNQTAIVLCAGSQGLLFAYMRTGQTKFRTAAIVMNASLVLALLNFELRPSHQHTYDVIYETGGTLRASQEFAAAAGKPQRAAKAHSREEWREKMQALNNRVQERKRQLQQPID